MTLGLLFIFFLYDYNTIINLVICFNISTSEQTLSYFVIMLKFDVINHHGVMCIVCNDGMST
jgi:hypothetical protein